MDKRFENEAARQAYGVFRKFGVCRFMEFSILSIARLEGIISCILDPKWLTGPIRKKQDGEPIAKCQIS